MWFPTMVQTSSGIQNVSKGYYDVARTMGASTLYQIINIAIPAALPQIFVGLFSGVTTSFITLMMAELMGSKYGIGWYINWQQQIMSYSNVWMAFLILAVCCFLVLKGLFALRKKFLSWQEGIIRW
jgi:NitT/TauT family transport system permease protein